MPWDAAHPRNTLLFPKATMLLAASAVNFDFVCAAKPNDER